MFERFTDLARKAMTLAKEQAQRFRHDYIGTEHILLGLARVGGGPAMQILRDFGVDADAIEREVEKMIAQGDAAPRGQVPFTPRAKKVLELSLEESKSLGHHYVGTEHLLLGLVRENEGVAARVLAKLGLEMAAVRGKIAEATGSCDTGLPPRPPAVSKFKLKSISPDALDDIRAELKAIRSDLDEIKELLRGK